MKLRVPTQLRAKVRNTRLRIQRLKTTGDHDERLRTLLKPVSFDEE